MVQGTPGQTRPQNPCLLRESLHRVRKPRAFKRGLFRNGTLTAIGAKYGKTPAQAALRWLTQRNIIVIPKTTHKERMIENLSIFDFTLTDDDMTAIAALDLGKSQWFNHQSAETAEQFMQWAGMH